jgi:hypothetical protein
MTEYLSNADLAAEIARCQKDMVVSDRLAKMLVLLVARIAGKPSFRSYSYNADMQCEALLQLVRRNAPSKKRNDYRPNILKFDETYAARKGLKPNPFAYASQIVMNVFRRSIKSEQGVAALRDDLLESANQQPSARRQVYNDANRSSDPIPTKPAGKKRGRKSKAIQGVAGTSAAGQVT